MFSIFLCCSNSSLKLFSSEYVHESIRREIRMARESFTGESLSQELNRIQKRLDTVELLSPDIVMNLLLSYRDIQVRLYNMAKWCACGDLELILLYFVYLTGLHLCYVTCAVFLSVFPLHCSWFYFCILYALVPV